MEPCCLPHSLFSSGRRRNPCCDPAVEEVGPWACLHKAVCPVVSETSSIIVEEVIKAVQVWFCDFKSHGAKKKSKNSLFFFLFNYLLNHTFSLMSK